MPNEKRRVDALPLFILACVAVAALAVWWLFPILQGWMAHQDCVALGRTNCG